MPSLTPDQWIVLAVLLGSLILFITDRLRYDIVALLVVVSLAATGVLSPRDAYAGFASPAVILVASPRSRMYASRSPAYCARMISL